MLDKLSTITIYRDLFEKNFMPYISDHLCTNKSMQILLVYSAIAIHPSNRPSYPTGEKKKTPPQQTNRKPKCPTLMLYLLVIYFLVDRLYITLTTLP